MATVIQWLIDTRPLFPSAKKTSDLPQAAPRAIALLTPPEAAAVLKYHFLADAKLALLSAVLKRLAIAELLGVPWARATPVRDARSKPVFYVDESCPGWSSGQGAEPSSSGPNESGSPSRESGSEGLKPGSPSREYGSEGLKHGSQPLLFNVSHQAGVVVLLAALRPSAPTAALGVDIVCPMERRARDLRTIREEGWGHFVGMHEEVFAAGEARRLRALRREPARMGRAEQAKNSKDTGKAKDTKDTEKAKDTDDARLEHFYALWCLREAWVKMTGEALLAPWLSELEMRNFAPPSGSGYVSTGPTTESQRQDEAADRATPPDTRRPDQTNHGQEYADDEKGLEVWFRGNRVDDVHVRLERWGGAYMIATAVRGEGIPLGAYEELGWEDVLGRAEALRARGGDWA